MQTYIDRILVKSLIPGQVVIMDNASFHKSKDIEKSILNAGCRLIYLPPYSPDLNPIEHYWAAIKNSMRKFLDDGKNLYQAAVKTFDLLATYP